MSRSAIRRVRAIPPARTSRRTFLGTGARGVAGIAGILAAGRGPAVAATRQLNVLTAVNYAPTPRTRSTIPNMFAKVVTNALGPKDAIRWAETEIKRAFEEP
jgi:hypothetical protein